MRHWPILLAFCFLLRADLSASAEDWPEFRGPTGQGLYAGKNLPIEWSTAKNVAWKTPIPGKGWSSPIVLAGRIYLTSAVPVEGTKNLSLKAICVDAARGTILWQTEVFEQDEKAPKIHAKNSHASPSPISDGKRLYVHFGHQGTACLDLEGKVLWKNREHVYAPVNGNGGSPILVPLTLPSPPDGGEGRVRGLIFSCDGGDKQFVVALDVANGKTLWKTDRATDAPQKFSFCTPLAISVDGKTQIVSPAAGGVMAYDPETGKEIWRVKYKGYSVIPRPVFGHGMVFLSCGYDSAVTMAIRVNGSGDVTQSHVAWTLKKGAPNTPSMLLLGDELYMVSDKGIASCVDARTGKVHWQEAVRGGYSASPFHADGKIFLQSEEGVTTVLRAGKKFEILASSKLEERTLASCAVADEAIYLRTESQLYRIQEKK